MVTDFYLFLLGVTASIQKSLGHLLWLCEPDSPGIWSLQKGCLLRHSTLSSSLDKTSSSELRKVASSCKKAPVWVIWLAADFVKKSRSWDLARRACGSCILLLWVCLCPSVDFKAASLGSTKPQGWGVASVLVWFTTLVLYWGTLDVNGKQSNQV